SVKELEGTAINQVCIGSCTNSSFRDLAVAAEILRKYGISQDVDLIISPGSRQVVSALEKIGALGALISAGARIIENACGPCIGMGCAPASRGISIRTFNRNFPGRSGTKDDRVLLSSVEVAAASAVYGKITDPRKSGKYPKVRQIKAYPKAKFILPPRSQKSRDKIQIVRGPNIKPLPEFKKPGEDFSLSVIIKLPDNVSTDDILPAGAKILPLRSNIPAISEFTFNRISPGFAKKAKENTGDLIIVAGENYGQGSSREHAAIVLRYLGIRAVLAKSFARIHYANLINFGIIPLTFEKSSDYDSIETGSKLEKSGTKSFQDIIGEGNKFILRDLTRGKEISVFLSLDERQRQIILSGSFLNYVRGK
ncbi:MAG: aconitase family protein, partial [Elusimicrobiota bacterium]